MDQQGITRGAIESVFKTGNATNHPIVQVIDLKRISAQNGVAGALPRYRLAISDGQHFQQAMLATQLNTLITQNKLQVNCLVRLMEVICNTVQVKRIVIILNVEVINKPMTMKIGNPISIDVVMSGGSNNNPPQQQQQQLQQQPQQPQPQYSAGIGNSAQQQPQKNMPFNGNGNMNNMNGGSTNGGVQQNNGFGAKPGNSGAAGFGGNSGNSWNAPNPFGGGGGGRGPSAITKMDAKPSGFFRPIQSINPYQNGWTIKGRCTFKSEIRTYQNARGEGQVISFEVTDESGSIRITGFTEAARKINDTVQMNHIYKISRGFLKQANEKYNRSTSSFEMTIDSNSELSEVDDDGSFMQIKYNFTKIAQLDSVDVKGNCDVVGVVTSIAPLSEITLRTTGEQCPRRTLTITDDSNAAVELTLWRRQAEIFLTEDAASRHPVLLVRNAMRGDFGGVSLNVSRMTTLELDPVNVPEANKLRAWFDGGGLNTATIQSITSSVGGGGGKITGPRKSLAEALIEDVEPAFATGGNTENASATFITRGMVTFVNTKNDLYYPGDPETKKKVVDQGQGMWMSESSGRTLSDNEIVWRYIVSMKVADHSSSQWVSSFDEVGTTLLGRSAKELRDLKEQDMTLYEHLVEDTLCRPMLMKVQVKERTWREARHIRYTVDRAEPIDFATETRTMLQEISAYM